MTIPPAVFRQYRTGLRLITTGAAVLSFGGVIGLTGRWHVAGPLCILGAMTLLYGLGRVRRAIGRSIIDERPPRPHIAAQASGEPPLVGDPAAHGGPRA